MSRSPGSLQKVRFTISCGMTIVSKREYATLYVIHGSDISLMRRCRKCRSGYGKSFFRLLPDSDGENRTVLAAVRLVEYARRVTENGKIKESRLLCKSEKGNVRRIYLSLAVTAMVVLVFQAIVFFSHIFNPIQIMILCAFIIMLDLLSG